MKDFALYKSGKAWINKDIWINEMEELNRKLGKENRKILLLSDNLSAHKELSLENIKFLFFVPKTNSPTYRNYPEI